MTLRLEPLGYSDDPRRLGDLRTWLASSIVRLRSLEQSPDSAPGDIEFEKAMQHKIRQELARMEMLAVTPECQANY